MAGSPGFTLHNPIRLLALRPRPIPRPHRRQAIRQNHLVQHHQRRSASLEKDNQGEERGVRPQKTKTADNLRRDLLPSLARQVRRFGTGHARILHPIRRQNSQRERSKNGQGAGDEEGDAVRAGAQKATRVGGEGGFCVREEVAVRRGGDPGADEERAGQDDGRAGGGGAGGGWELEGVAGDGGERGAWQPDVLV